MGHLRAGQNLCQCDMNGHPLCVLEPASASKSPLEYIHVIYLCWCVKTEIATNRKKWMLDQNVSAALPCIPPHSCRHISLWSFRLYFADCKQTESAPFFIRLSGRMCSNGIPICPLSSPHSLKWWSIYWEWLLDFLSTEDVDPEADSWMDLPLGKFFPPQLIDISITQLNGVLRLFRSVRHVRRPVLFQLLQVKGCEWAN